MGYFGTCCSEVAAETQELEIRNVWMKKKTPPGFSAPVELHGGVFPFCLAQVQLPVPCAPGEVVGIPPPSVFAVREPEAC